MADQFTLSYAGLGQVRVVFGDAALVAGVGCHQLKLPITTWASWLSAEDSSWQAATPLLLVGDVWADVPTHRFLAPLAPAVLSLHGFDASDDLCVAVPDDQLIAIERTRGQEDLVLRLNLCATLLQPPPGTHYPGIQLQTTVRIHRSRWTEMLDSAGTEVGIVLRVPSPLTDGPHPPEPTNASVDAPSLAQAAARLRHARQQLREGGFEDCVATCRRVLENITKLGPPSGYSQVFNTERKQRSQAQRWAAVHLMLVSLTDAAHHDDDITAHFAWSREDAQAVLAMTAALLVRVNR
jgi:hypothetical protein